METIRGKLTKNGLFLNAVEGLFALCQVSLTNFCVCLSRFVAACGACYGYFPEGYMHTLRGFPFSQEYPFLFLPVEIGIFSFSDEDCFQERYSTLL
jgi:hypothetical protein